MGQKIQCGISSTLVVHIGSIRPHLSKTVKQLALNLLLIVTNLVNCEIWLTIMNRTQAGRVEGEGVNHIVLCYTATVASSCATR